MKQGCPQAVIRCFKYILTVCPWNLAKEYTSKGTSISHLEEEEFQFSTINKHTSEEGERYNQNNDPKIHQTNSFAEEQNVEVKLNFPQQTAGNLSSEPKASILQPIPTYDFKLNLQPSNQYFELLDSRTQSLQLLFQQQSSIIVSRSNKSQISIREVESVGIFKLILSYWLPCSYAYYASLSRDLSLQLASIVSDHQTTEVLQPNLTVNQLQFRKFMLLEPRWFNYIKYINSSGSSHWETCLSVKGRPNSDTSLKECELFAVTCFHDVGHGLSVNSYVEVDIKSNIRARKVVQRVCQQMANYFDSLWGYVEKHYSQVIA